MISFFKKKVLIKDRLKGLTDIHNHILPGIDDGAQNIEDSIALIQKYGELGITDFIATPHIMNDFYPNTPDTIHEALNKLKTALKEEGLEKVKIRAAAEYMMDQGFLEILQKEKLLCLSENYVLVEMSYFQPPINLNEILFQLQTQGYRPVLAHPERYAYFHSKKLEKFEELKDRGCFFQLNLLSLTGHYGKQIGQVANQLLDLKMIDFTGSDTHQPRHLEKLSAEKIPEKQIEQLIPVIDKTNQTFRLSF